MSRDTLSDVASEVANALKMLSLSFREKVPDGFGISEVSVATLLRACISNGRKFSRERHLSLELECGMQVRRGRPTRASGAVGEWVVVTPEIFAAELLAHSEWEFDDVAATLSHLPGAVRGEAKCEYLGIIEVRETISIPLALLLEYFPGLRDTPQAPAKPAKVRVTGEPKPTPAEAVQIRKMREQGYRIEVLAEKFNVSTVQIYRAVHGNNGGNPGKKV